MTQEQKDILLKDLCARLPYGVKVQSTFYCCNGTIWKYENEILTAGLLGYPISRYKPYLFPLLSMSKEQKSELSRFCDCPIYVTNWNFRFPDYVHNTMNSWEKAFTWLNKHHFDYRGLIEQGLAIDATGLNIY
jgi:hypothetical protein